MSGFERAANLLLMSLDHLLRDSETHESRDLALSLKERVDKILAVEPSPAVASAPPDDPLHTEPVRFIAQYLKVCDETVRKLCRDGVLQTVRKGTGRNYEVVVASAVAYKRRMVSGGGNGVPAVGSEAQALASEVARPRK